MDNKTVTDVVRKNKTELLASCSALSTTSLHLCKELQCMVEDDEMATDPAERYEPAAYADRAEAVQLLVKAMRSCLKAADDLDTFVDMHTDSDDDGDDDADADTSKDDDDDDE